MRTFFNNIFNGRKLLQLLVLSKYSYFSEFYLSLSFHLLLYRLWGVDYYAYLTAVQFSSVAPTLCDPWDCSTPSFPSITNPRSLLKLMSIESVMLSNHLILCHPLLLLPSILPSIRVFSNESVLHIRWPKYWSFSFSIHPANEISGLISFTIDWFDLLAVQGTLKNLLQHHSSKALIHQCSAFLYSPTFISINDYWKNHSFTI